MIVLKETKNFGKIELWHYVYNFLNNDFVEILFSITKRRAIVEVVATGIYIEVRTGGSYYRSLWVIVTYLSSVLLTTINQLVYL